MTTPTASVTLPRLHAAQWEIARHSARFKVVACGRRFGKTDYGALETFKAGLEGGRAWWIAPTFGVAEVGWRRLQFLAGQLGALAEVRLAERAIQFAGGGVARVRTGNDPDALRGDSLDLAVLDEAAFMRPDVWNAAIRPALADRKGRALFLSTPNGRNWFFRLYLMGQDRARQDWQSWRFPTSANPYIDPAEIEAARDLLPARLFAQEFEAEFLEDGSGVFRNVPACATVTGRPRRQAGHTYIFGLDWGRDKDYTAVAVFDATDRQLVAMDRFNRIGWSLQRGRLAALARYWRPAEIWAEENSIGGPNIEALQAEGLPVRAFTTTAQSKGPLIESLALAFEKSEIAILNDESLIAELLAYQMDRLPSGRYRYGAPVGMHDDQVIALALAWHGVIRGWARVSFGADPFMV